MPIYEYTCQKCEKHFEALIRSDGDQPTCPQCGGKRLQKQFSVAAAHTAQSRQLPTCPAMAGGCGGPQCGTGGCPLS